MWASECLQADRWTDPNVPLEAGQFLALFASTDQKSWMMDQAIMLCQFLLKGTMMV